MTAVAPGRRLTGPERHQFANWCRERYESGASIRVLTGETGRSYGSIHSLLVESGAVLRTRGGANGATSPDE